MEGALPFAEQARLESGERGFAEFIATVRDRAPEQVFAATAGGFDQGDDPGPGPARPAQDARLIDPRQFDRPAVGAKMIRRRRHQGLHPRGQAVVGEIVALFVETAKFTEDFVFGPDHRKPRMGDGTCQYQHRLRKDKNEKTFVSMGKGD